MPIPTTERAKRNHGARRDPAPRSIEGVPAHFKLKTKNESMHYVWTNPGDPDTGTDSYLARGYEIVHFGEGVEMAAMHKKPEAGTVMTYRDQVLVARPLADVEAERAAGQKLADEVEDRIIDKSRGIDGFRGVTGRSGRPIVSVENETTPSMTWEE